MNRSSFGSFLNWSIRVGRLFGIPIDLHITILFFLLPVLMHRGTNAWFNLEASALIVLSILLHELGHALTAKRFHLTGLSITLHGFGGFAMSQGARTWKQSLLITLAGPGVNLAIGVLCLIPALAGNYDNPAHWYQMVAFLGSMNLSMAVLNMIPTLPFDGGRAVEAILIPRIGDFKALRAIGHIGLVVSGIVILLGVIAGSSYFPTFGLIGFVTSLSTLQNSGGIRFGEFTADRRAKKEMEAVKKREKAKKDEFLSDVVMREREREANERLRKLLGDD